MKVLVTGVSGQLGYDVVNNLISRGYEAIGSDIHKMYNGVADGSPVTTAQYIEMDITEKNSVNNVLTELKPDVIIHCAAWTAVDAAEKEENRVRVDAINHIGTRNIANAAKSIDAKMVYISTDYVFDGQGTRPWEPDDKSFAPLNVYGQSKLDGEFAVSKLLEKFFIVRIAWVFGKNGKNFIKTMLRIGKNREFVTVVDDQIGTPTYTFDLARLLVDMVETEKYGFYHVTNSEIDGQYISWADFTQWIYDVAGYSTKVNKVTTMEYGASVAARPFNSRLDKKKLVEAGFMPLPTWKDAVKRYMRELDLEDL